MSEPLDQLLGQLSIEDGTAAAEVFHAYEPFLRKAVRRHLNPTLGSKFDSTDILQSVWVDVLRGFREAGWRFTDADHLRGFLYVATRNRLIDRTRQHQRAHRRETTLHDGKFPTSPTAAPPPSALAQAEEIWQRILENCPPEHRSILILKREGHSLEEIAKRTNLHADSIRRILRQLARRLAFAGVST